MLIVSNVKEISNANGQCMLVPREALVCRGTRGVTMTWMTVVMMIVLPLVIRGCEAATLGSHFEEPLKENGDSWTANVRVKPNHDDDWQLNLILTVMEATQATPVMNLTLNHTSYYRIIRLHGHFGVGEITEDGFLSMRENQSFTLAVTVRRYDLDLQMDQVKKTEAHGLKNFDDIRTSVLELTNIVAAENFSVSCDCVEVNNSTSTTPKYSVHTTLPENRTNVIAAASCGAAALVMAATWVIYCTSRRLRGCPPVNEASCSIQDKRPRPVHAQAQQDISIHASSDNTYANVATPAQEHSTAHATWAASGQMGTDSELRVDEHHSFFEEHIYGSASGIAESMYTDCDIDERIYTDCAKYQQKCSPDEHIYESASDLAELMYTNCTNCQESFPEESIYENASDIKEQMYTGCANYQCNSH
ncbi:uncharacterized protein LOC119572425 [Penaeus monodon]|uniref:uncharacterized protein LOC119572425 n=1 Tax=Penaeus monodon TaxID=6687 RepID=UPI0018A7090A|nr:uncharacterized protein LOC119572425 [Penaeus monodon]